MPSPHCNCLILLSFMSAIANGQPDLHIDTGRLKAFCWAFVRRGFFFPSSFSNIDLLTSSRLAPFHPQSACSCPSFTVAVVRGGNVFLTWSDNGSISERRNAGLSRFRWNGHSLPFPPAGLVQAHKSHFVKERQIVSARRRSAARLLGIKERGKFPASSGSQITDSACHCPLYERILHMI